MESKRNVNVSKEGETPRKVVYYDPKESPEETGDRKVAAFIDLYEDWMKVPLFYSPMVQAEIYDFYVQKINIFTIHFNPLDFTIPKIIEELLQSMNRDQRARVQMFLAQKNPVQEPKRLKIAGEYFKAKNVVLLRRLRNALDESLEDVRLAQGLQNVRVSPKGLRVD